jgi:hypothetical protein
MPTSYNGDVYNNKITKVIDYVKQVAKLQSQQRDDDFEKPYHPININFETKYLTDKIHSLQIELEKIKKQSIEEFKVDVIIQLTDQITYYKNIIDSNEKNKFRVIKLSNELDSLDFPEEYHGFKKFCHDQLINLNNFDYNNDFVKNTLYNLQLKLDTLNIINYKDCKIIELTSQIASYKLKLKDQIESLTRYNTFYTNLFKFIDKVDSSKEK